MSAFDMKIPDVAEHLPDSMSEDPIVANSGPQPEPDFFDTFGSHEPSEPERGFADWEGAAIDLAPAGGAPFLGGNVGAALTVGGSDGPLVDSGAPDHLLGGLSGGVGAAEFADGFVGVGNSRASQALSIAGAINTFMTHDPVTSGPITSMAERTAMAGTDLAWGMIGGPTAVADAATGGNLAGGLKIAMGGAFAMGDAIATGNNRSLFNLERSIDKGNFGGAAQYLSENSPFALYPYGPTIEQQRQIDRENRD